jgi:hypothetical protein
VGAELSRFLAEARNELTLLDARARRLGHEGIAVLLDSLTKLRGTTANWREVTTSAEHLFVRDLSYLELPVRAVYTVPASATLRLGAPVHFLPQIALFSRTGQVSAAGFDAARHIVRQRLSETELTDVFGSDVEHRIDQLITWSAGNPHALVQLLQSVVAERLLDGPLFERVLSLQGDQYRRIVPGTAYPWLARVHVEKSLPVENEEQRELAERMLSSGVVLRYQGESAWFDVHPAAKRIPGLDEAIRRLGAGT